MYVQESTKNIKQKKLNTKNIKNTKKMNSDCQNNQPVKNTFLVTGGCGFIGSGMVHYLHTKFPHDPIIVVDKMSYCSHENNIPRHDNIVLYRDDICDLDKMFSVLQTHGVTVVIHFAACTHVDNSFANSCIFTKDNVLGTHHLLEACRKHGHIKKFIHISSDEVLGEVAHGEDALTENALMNPSNPYSASKCSAEFVVRSYNISYGLPSVTVRMNNVFGIRQFPEKCVPRFILLALDGKPITLQGSGRQTRSFIHLDDVCSGIFLVYEKGKVGDVYNIGTDFEISIRDLGSLIWKLTRDYREDPTVENVTFLEIEDRKLNDVRYRINCDKINSLGQWKHSDMNLASFTKQLLPIIAWYHENKNYWGSKFELKIDSTVHDTTNV